MTETVVLEIQGMSCEGCVRRVRKLLENATEGTVREVRIGSASVDVASADDSAPKLVSVLSNAGYVTTARQNA